jgi:hypothetical protein
MTGRLPILLRLDMELATLVTKKRAWLDEPFSECRHTTTKSERVPYSVPLGARAGDIAPC